MILLWHQCFPPSQGSDRLCSDFGVRVGLMAIVEAIVVIIVGLCVVILHHLTCVSVASCKLQTLLRDDAMEKS